MKYALVQLNPSATERLHITASKYNNSVVLENTGESKMRNILSHSVTFAYEALLYLHPVQSTKCYTSDLRCYTFDSRPLRSTRPIQKGAAVYSTRINPRSEMAHPLQHYVQSIFLLDAPSILRCNPPSIKQCNNFAQQIGGAFRHH